MVQVPMTPVQFENAKQELTQQGIQIGGETGVISAHDVTADYAYDGINLSVTVTHAPFGADHLAEGKIKAALLAAVVG